jgi:AcrR family transcriptional regulator
MKPDARRTTYHHGDARNALLRAAAGLLEQAGAAGLSLRQVAERAGLSRQAPYNHFKDKEALLADLVREGFDRLAREVGAAGETAGTPVEGLERAGACYIAFAQTTPALFRLMFSKELVDLSCHATAQAASASAYGQLTAIIATIVVAEMVPDVTLAAWSIVHGYATLCLETGFEGPESRPKRAALFARIIAASG